MSERFWKRITWEQVKDEANARGQALKEIIELHEPEKIFDEWYCSHCLETINWETDQAAYPCDTMKIIHNHLGDQ